MDHSSVYIDITYYYVICMSEDMGFELMTSGMPLIKVYAFYLRGIRDQTTDGCPNDILVFARRILARDMKMHHIS